MQKKYIIGIDGGSQSSKVVIYDLAGNIVSEGSEPLRPLDLPAPGLAEHPEDDLWDTIVSACQKAMSNFEGDPKEIIGVGLCTIRCCRACLKRDGSLASPVQSWMDIRLSKPYDHTNPTVRYVTTSSGYISHRFTGEYKDTASNYEGPWPIDKDTWQWSEDPATIAYYNIPRDMLFELVKPGDNLGKVTQKASEETGIPAGIPVIATANDKAVEALGAGLPPGNNLLVSLGTYICSMMIGEKNVKDAQHFFSNMASMPHQYLYESGGIRRGMWTVSWFTNLLGQELVNRAFECGMSPAEFINAEAEQVPVGSEGLMTVLDWLAPPSQPFKRGLMIGFDGRHTRAHIYRSILEAIALSMKNHADAMCEELGVTLEKVIVSGGGSNSNLFMQIFADVFGLPAVRNKVNGSASLGSAICVAVALEQYDSFPEAIHNMVEKGDTFLPIKHNTDIYQRINKNVYQRIPEFTDGILKIAYSTFQ